MLTIEEMLKFLGVRTQSKESIGLCYKMDMTAFSMMEKPNCKYIKEKYTYTCVYNLLSYQLGYKVLDPISLENAIAEVEKISLEETDKEYRDLYFTGLERILLRFNRFDLVAFQRIKESSFEGMAKDAYLYELGGSLDMAISYYKKLGFKNRIEICEKKKLEN